MSWVYRQPHTEWFYGRDHFVPLGTPPEVGINVPAGGLLLGGETPGVSTEQATGVQIPHVIPYLVPAGGGTYRTTFRVAYRIQVIPEATGPATGVGINAPAGGINFVGEAANLGDTVIRVPLGTFTMTGHIPASPSTLRLFEGLRRSVGRLLRCGIHARSRKRDH